MILGSMRKIIGNGPWAKLGDVSGWSPENCISIAPLDQRLAGIFIGII
jgi:hypothetical protein